MGNEQGSVQVPVQVTLHAALDDDYELAVCASSLFILIVQDRFELGGGFGIQIIALDRLVTVYCETLEQVENYLAEHTPYTKHTPVWMRLPSYHSGKQETEYIKRIWEKVPPSSSLQGS